MAGLIGPSIVSSMNCSLFVVDLYGYVFLFKIAYDSA